MTIYRCPVCGSTIGRENLVADREKKTEIITIRATTTTKTNWEQFLAENGLKNAEDGLRFAIQKRQADFDVTIKGKDV